MFAFLIYVYRGAKTNNLINMLCFIYQDKKWVASYSSQFCAVYKILENYRKFAEFYQFPKAKSTSQLDGLLKSSTSNQRPVAKTLKFNRHPLCPVTGKTVRLDSFNFYFFPYQTLCDNDKIQNFLP